MFLTIPTVAHYLLTAARFVLHPPHNHNPSGASIEYIRWAIFSCLDFLDFHIGKTFGSWHSLSHLLWHFQKLKAKLSVKTRMSLFTETWPRQKKPTSLGFEFCFELLTNALGRTDFEITTTNKNVANDSIWDHSRACRCLSDRQARPEKEWSEADISEVLRPSRLHRSQIPKALSLSLAMTSPRHFLQFLLGELWKLLQKLYRMLAFGKCFAQQCLSAGCTFPTYGSCFNRDYSWPIDFFAQRQIRWNALSLQTGFHWKSTFVREIPLKRVARETRPGFVHLWNCLFSVVFHWNDTIENTCVVWFMLLSPKIDIICVQTLAFPAIFATLACDSSDM